MFDAKKILALILCCCVILSIVAPAAVLAKGWSSGSKGGGRSFSTVTHNSSSGKRDFSTPRSTTPDSLTKDYNTGTKGYSSDKNSYSTARSSYTGTWNREDAKDLDRYPSRTPVKINGSPPAPPYEYHNNYWDHSWLFHRFFHPTYHHTSWGYGYYEPDFFSWFLVCLILVLAVLLYYRYFKVSSDKEDS